MLPVHLVFKWCPNWTRDRVRWWGETVLFVISAGFFGIMYGGRPEYVMVRLIILLLDTFIPNVLLLHYY